MNALERADWLSAVEACVPQARAARVRETAEAFEAASPGRWEVSVRAGELESVGLRFFGAGDHASWRAACAGAFSLGLDEGPAAPAPGLPWAAACWDLRTSRWTSLRLYGAAPGARGARAGGAVWEFEPGGKAGKGGKPRPLACKPYEPGLFGEPSLDAALADFAALCPVESLTVDGAGWALKLARPLRWPLFARCDLANSFARHSSQLALFLLDRGVTELSFDGAALWAHLAG